MTHLFQRQFLLHKVEVAEKLRLLRLGSLLTILRRERLLRMRPLQDIYPGETHGCERRNNLLPPPNYNSAVAGLELNVVFPSRRSNSS